MLEKLGKLLKYEFRFYFRIMPPLYLILLLLALPAGFQMRNSEYNMILPVLLTVIWGIIIGAMVIANLVLIIQRFTDNLLKNPGSLMFTLPVTTWALTASKAIAALCTVLMSIIVISVSGIIYAAGMGVLSFADLNISGSPLEIMVFIIIAIIMIFQQICLIYATISASHILPKFRFVASVLMYFAIMNFVEVPLFRLILSFQVVDHSLLDFGFFNFYSTVIPYGIAGIAFAALFFWTTGFLLKNTLNLE